MTRRFDAPEADEADWQERIVRHLGLRRLAAASSFGDELDVVGPSPPSTSASTASSGHRRSPATSRSSRPSAAASLLDGEGGDQVLELLGAPHRAGRRRGAPPRPVRRSRATARRCMRARRRWRAVARRPRHAASTPAAVAAPGRPAARRGGARRATSEARPLSFAASVALGAPASGRGARATGNRAILTARYGVAHSSPLLDPDVVDASLETAASSGAGDRTAVLRVAGRRSAARRRPVAHVDQGHVHTCYMASHTRAFAERWDGRRRRSRARRCGAAAGGWLADRPHRRRLRCCRRRGWRPAISSAIEMRPRLSTDTALRRSGGAVAGGSQSPGCTSGSSVLAVAITIDPGGDHMDMTYDTPTVTELGSVADFTRGDRSGPQWRRLLRLPRRPRPVRAAAAAAEHQSD